MKNKVLLVTVLILFVLGIANISNASSDPSNFTFELNEDKTGYVVKRAKVYTGTDRENILEIPNEYEGLPVVELGREAFYNYGYESNLTEIYIPSSVKKIDYGCFMYCSYLRKVTMEEGVTNIEGSAFYGCSALENIEIPVSVESIGGTAFYNCSSLTSANIKANIQEIPSSLFEGCRNLTNISIPDSVNKIGTKAFYGCNLLENINLSSNLESIDSQAFVGTSIKSLIIPDGTKKISWSMINDSLIEITLPSTLTEIEAYSIQKMENLIIYVHESSLAENFAIANDFQYINIDIESEIVENNVRYELINNKNVNIVGYTSDFSGILNIPEEVNGYKVVAIKKGAFKNCTNLTEVNFSKNVKRIEINAFEGCTRLTDIVLPEELDEIQKDAFLNCTALKNATMPITVNPDAGESSQISNKIYGPIFYNCTSLEKISLTYGKNGKMSNFSCNVGFSNNKLEGIFPPWSSDVCSKYEVTEDIVSYGNGGFAGCSAMKNFTISKNVDSLNKCLFSGCSSLESLEIPYNITTLNESCFHGLKNLKELRIPASVTTINGLPFWCLATLTQEKMNIYMPTSIENPSSSLFCIDMRNNVNIFENIYFYKNSNIDKLISTTNIKQFYIEPSIDCAYRIVNASEVTILGSLKDENETAIVIPENYDNLPVTSISENAFANLSNITSVTIPKTVTKIAVNAFENHNENLVIFGEKGSYAEEFANSNNITFNEITKLTTVETEKVEVNGEELDTMKIEKNVSKKISDFINEENFPAIATYTVKVLDISGNEKTEDQRVGSKNVIQITNEAGEKIAEYTVVVPGDVTGNGYSRMYDAFQILKDSLFNGKLDEIDMLIRDYDGNGAVRMYDAFQFLKDSLFN